MIRPRLLVPALGIAAAAGTNAIAQGRLISDRTPAEPLPFAVEEVARFDSPWAIGVLPDGRLLVSEHAGRLYLVDGGTRAEVSGLPRVEQSGQLGFHDIAPAPDFADSGTVYLSYVAPGEGGSQLVLARAVLDAAGPALRDLSELWRQPEGGGGGHPGARIAFDPAGGHLFLSVGDRTLEAEGPQDPAHSRGKVLRMALDGEAPGDNPFAGQEGTAPLVWTYGHRNPYGLAFAPDGTLWSHEMGPRGGDELNRIEAGENYGWPVVSNGVEYSGDEIPDHDTRPEFAAPTLTWTPVISPAGMVFYQGDLFPDWQGSALIGGLSSQALVRVTVTGDVDEAERWNMGARIRDVAVTPDGAVWVIEDGSGGRLLRLTPEG